jgi:hypothetical protein
MNAMRQILLQVSLLFLLLPTSAQDQPEIRGFYLGVGLGQDVGGLGLRATYWPVPYAAGFIGGGWAFAGGGYNAGIELRLPGASRTSGFITGMYGYNGGIVIKGREDLNALYFGPTVGGGVMLQQRMIGNYWRFSINVPLRSQEMYDNWEVIKNRPDISVRQDLLPVTFGVGLHVHIQWWMSCAGDAFTRCTYKNS